MLVNAVHDGSSSVRDVDVASRIIMSGRAQTLNRNVLVELCDVQIRLIAAVVVKYSIGVADDATRIHTRRHADWGGKLVQ